jgi:hypothetical protein
MSILELYGDEFCRLQGNLDELQDEILAHLKAYDSIMAIRSSDELIRAQSV